MVIQAIRTYVDPKFLSGLAKIRTMHIGFFFDFLIFFKKFDEFLVYSLPASYGDRILIHTIFFVNLHMRKLTDNSDD